MSKYYKVDGEFQENTSHYKIISYINDNDTVLEFGCASGYMSKYMHEKLGCKVYGIELCREALDEALPFLEKGVCADIDELNWKEEISNIKFDVIMFADVMEHLKNPVDVLQTAVEFLKDDGKVIISIPNIAHGDIVCKLLNNHFDYTDTGLLDDTHIHFWGSENIDVFCEKCGLSLVELNGTICPIQGSEQRLSSSLEYGSLNAISQNPYSSVYQFVFVAYKTEFAKKHRLHKNMPIDEITSDFWGINSSKIYFEIGGFSEEKTVQIPIRSNFIKSGRISIPSNCTGIRFDPIENYSCVIGNLVIGSSNGLLTVQSGNYEYETCGNYFFSNLDPSVYIHFPENTSWVELSCMFTVFDNIFEQKIIRDFHDVVNQKAEECSKLNTELEILDEKNKSDILALTEQKNSEMDALSGELKNLKVLNSDMQGELERYKSDYGDAIKEQDDLQRQVAHWRGQTAYWRNSYNIVNNSQFWKMTKPFRAVLDAFKNLKKKTPVQAIENKEEIFLSNLSNITVDEISTVDIIIPVYNGFEYFDHLFGSIPKTKIPYRLIIVEDKSSDARVLPYLKRMFKNSENVVLLENASNLGFVKSVNRALSVSKNNVVLLNTDVELPNNWLERIMYPIIANENVASTTPFTNSGTTCSFPNFCEDNKLFFGLNVDEIDAYFSNYTPKYPIIPTGVGFCMGMSRKAIDKIGLLDDKTFGKGYGEENDWCRRAVEEGFVNVHVDNLFVFHNHGGSFDSDEKKRLIKEHGELLEKKHPQYNAIVAEYCALDPCAEMRKQIKSQILREFAPAHTIVAFNHYWGGGADMYLLRERKRVLNEGNEFVQVVYMPGSKSFKVEYCYHHYYDQTILCAEFSEILKLLPQKIDEIWINELVSYPELFVVLEQIVELAKETKAKTLFLLHDYFSICPTINLIDYNNSYCDLLDYDDCEKCLFNNIRFNNIHQLERMEGIKNWRTNWNKLFKACDEIRVFSNSSKEIFHKAYPEISIDKIALRPHKIEYISKIDCKIKRTNTLNIGVIGNLQENKGVYVVIEISKLIKQYDINARVFVIGDSEPVISNDLCKCTGEYSRAGLPTKILENDIDIILIPSIWPETFSYTAQEAIEMEMPIACFDIGAPAERVAQYDKGIVIPHIDADMALRYLIEYGEKQQLETKKESRKILFVVEQTDYASRYRVEHFQEELMFKGIDSDMVLLNKTSQADLKDICAVVFYRCSGVIGTSHLIEQVKKHNIKSFFDIDDLIFDKDIINKSELPSEEKKQYLALSDSYSKIIKQCDGVITSTENLAEHLRSCFPGKFVFVRRNSASLEMENLSVCAGNNVSDGIDQEVRIAYFSGSWTHDKDFEIIVEPIANILKKYPNTVIQIYGCLHIPAKLKPFKQQIETFEFTSDWRTLPEKIANAHIHLAPLADNEFNACKSENKWVEAALCARPIVASRNSELDRVIDDGVTGFLCKTESEWEETLSDLVEKPEIREQIGKRAQEEVLRTHLTRNNDINSLISNMGLN